MKNWKEIEKEVKHCTNLVGYFIFEVNLNGNNNIYVIRLCINLEDKNN